jgi:hypothetical protein
LLDVRKDQSSFVIPAEGVALEAEAQLAALRLQEDDLLLRR